MQSAQNQSYLSSDNVSPKKVSYISANDQQVEKSKFKKHVDSIHSILDGELGKKGEELHQV
jgi:hypothetical protein